MAGRSVVSPHNQKVTWVELFFDLVFVFAVTQVVDILEKRFGLVAVIRALLVFWLIWWAWTQFTWALNAADTTHPHVELGTLIATAIAFFMAVAVPLAFEVQPLAFALPYVLVRGVGLYIYSSCDYRAGRIVDRGRISIVRHGTLSGPTRGSSAFGCGHMRSLVDLLYEDKAGTGSNPRVEDGR